MPFPSPEPFEVIAARIGARTPVGTRLNSAQIARTIPAALRRAAAFSARINNARFLDRMQRLLNAIATGMREAIDEPQPDQPQPDPQAPDPTFPPSHLPTRDSAFPLAPPAPSVTLDRSRFVELLQQTAEAEGIRPATEKDGRQSITDPGSIARLNLIFEVNTRQAEGYAQWVSDQDPDLLEFYPAYQFHRLEDREEPRIKWDDRFRRAVRQSGQGLIIEDPAAEYKARMYGLKTDIALWTALSLQGDAKFANPYPPFDFHSGMGWTPIDVIEAEELGLVQPGAPPQQPVIDQFQKQERASLAGIKDNQLQAYLADSFQGQPITIDPNDQTISLTDDR